MSGCEIREGLNDIPDPDGCLGQQPELEAQVRLVRVTYGTGLYRCPSLCKAPWLPGRVHGKKVSEVRFAGPVRTHTGVSPHPLASLPHPPHPHLLWGHIIALLFLLPLLLAVGNPTVLLSYPLQNGVPLEPGCHLLDLLSQLSWSA